GVVVVGEVADAEGQEREPAVALDDVPDRDVVSLEIGLELGVGVLDRAVIELELGSVGLTREQLAAAGLGDGRVALTSDLRDQVIEGSRVKPAGWAPVWGALEQALDVAARELGAVG